MCKQCFSKYEKLLDAYPEHEETSRMAVAKVMSFLGQSFMDNEDNRNIMAMDENTYNALEKTGAAPVFTLLTVLALTLVRDIEDEQAAAKLSEMFEAITKDSLDLANSANGHRAFSRLAGKYVLEQIKDEKFTSGDEEDSENTENTQVIKVRTVNEMVDILKSISEKVTKH